MLEDSIILQGKYVTLRIASLVGQAVSYYLSN
jgi:hypothetical protein